MITYLKKYLPNLYAEITKWSKILYVVYPNLLLVSVNVTYRPEATGRVSDSFAVIRLPEFSPRQARFHPKS